MVAHPFHIHDVQFFILDRDGVSVSAEERGYKDVVMIGPNETLRFITKFEDFADPEMPYMYHCHILMHEDDGMMGQFIVVPEASTGLNDLKSKKEEINIFPNPVDDILSIEFSDGSVPKSYSYRIVDSMGITIEHSTDLNQRNVNVSNLSPGIYTLLLESENEIYSVKLIKN
jgi:bilirubin oxidase